MSEHILWAESAEEPAPQTDATLQGVVDVAVIGGGYTGLSTALFAAQAGMDVHLVEAEEIGFGGSGRNVGLVNAGLWLPPGQLIEALGPDYGPGFVRLFGEGPAQVFDLIEKHQIRCEARREGTIHAAHSPKGLEDLRSRAEAWEKLGAPVSLISAEDTAALSGTQAYCGGLLDRRAGTVNPMGYARGLARAALGAGARITCGARVTGLRRDNGLWQVQTGEGALAARQVVLATNAYADGLWPGLAQSWTEINFFQLATAPLGPEATAILPKGQGLWDTATIMTSLRRDAAGRIILGAMGRLHGDRTGGLSAAWARRRLCRLFPDLQIPAFEGAWDGRIAMTQDYLPRLCRLDDGIWAPMGYNGRGITTGTLFGRALADVLRGAPESSLPLPVTAPQPQPLTGLRSTALGAVFSANQAFRSVL
jgi:glycine/D-amino acid oxidase-like deaminating enzyme